MLYRTFQVENKTIAIWKVTENLEELKTMVAPNALFLSNIEQIRSDKRKMEKLAVYCLFQEMSLDYSSLTYSLSGRPLLKDTFISISHTDNFVAVALSEQPLGLDIQKIDRRIKNLKNRFVSDDEWIDSENEIIHLMLHWSAKEAMYKWIDQQDVFLTKHLHVKPFHVENSGFFDVWETKTQVELHSKAYYEVEKEFVLVVVGN